jgi:hypothetical protein
MNINQRISLCYKVPRTTSFVQKDIAVIKRINPILLKLERTNQDIYILETFNIIKSLDNIFDLGKLYLILCEYVDFKFHSTLCYLISELDSLEKDKNNTIAKKLKDLVQETD